MDIQRLLLVFHLADQLAALPLANVERVTPLAELSRPPGLPSSLEGILNLPGRAVPVWRLDRLLGLPEQRPGLYSMLILVKDVSNGRSAMLVDRVSEILSVSEAMLLPVGKGETFNGCAEATVAARGRMIHLLSPERILMREESEALAEFQATAQCRIREWEPAIR
jgi:purine-binding chemotaxis protein CheW